MTGLSQDVIKTMGVCLLIKYRLDAFVCWIPFNSIT